ncbi:TAXI family TRAP transporter solute-binding subunit [Allorhizocola rhizosphaerae]|uniref:TAXI family TRAP transporter solute-binding subunit n=1 Tax=Allorhizocola rhizosphaerae TaxID=1872709 RepID=UPI000E3C36B4|nr:TAXI family TRAP transporter solute-binding subunit [Allorhizocola rhizosphaerae]
MRTVAAAVGLGLVLAGGCTPTERAPLDRLTIAAGREGGVYYDLGKALAGEAQRLWSVPADVLRTDESVENVRRLDSREADVGFTTLDAGMAALRAEYPFRNVIRVSAIAGIYVDYLHVVVRADSGITTLRGLADRRVAWGPDGSGLRMVARRMLDTIRVTGLDLAPAEAAAALRTGEIDAFFVLGGLPTPTVTDLAGQLKIRVLPVGDEFSRLSGAFKDTYLLRSIPKGAYPGLDAPVLTLGVPNALVVRADLPEQTAYRLTQLLFAAKPALASQHPEARHLAHRSAIATFPMPLHPGAERYYRDTKPLL